MPAPTHVFSASTLVFGPGTGNDHAATPSVEGVKPPSSFGDLNKATDEELAAAKAKMSIVFDKKSLKPGDDGFEWDVRRDFVATESNDWDSEESD